MSRINNSTTPYPQLEAKIADYRDNLKAKLNKEESLRQNEVNEYLEAKIRNILQSINDSLSEGSLRITLSDIPNNTDIDFVERIVLALKNHINIHNLKIYAQPQNVILFDWKEGVKKDR